VAATKNFERLVRARQVRDFNAAFRALDNPVLVRRAEKIIRAALERGVLTLDELRVPLTLERTASE
jgi:hypothetical protein